MTSPLKLSRIQVRICSGSAHAIYEQEINDNCRKLKIIIVSKQNIYTIAYNS